LIKKDLKSLPVEVNTSDSKIPRFVTRLPGKLLSEELSAEENSSENSNLNSGGHVNDQRKLEESEHQSGSDDESDVYFETEALCVFCWAEEKKKQARQQLRGEESARPCNVDTSSNAPPNQGRHFCCPKGI
jgi:hypothetical protein